MKNFYIKKKDILLDQLPETAENNAGDIDIKLDIERAVDSLPDELREVAILFFFQDLKQAEIAQILNIKLSLVKYRISRAKILLAEYLGDNNEIL